MIEIRVSDVTDGDKPQDSMHGISILTKVENPLVSIIEDDGSLNIHVHPEPFAEFINKYDQFTRARQQLESTLVAHKEYLSSISTKDFNAYTALLFAVGKAYYKVAEKYAYMHAIQRVFTVHSYGVVNREILGEYKDKYFDEKFPIGYVIDITGYDGYLKRKRFVDIVQEVQTELTMTLISVKHQCDRYDFFSLAEILADETQSSKDVCPSDKSPEFKEIMKEIDKYLKLMSQLTLKDNLFKEARRYAIEVGQSYDEDEKIETLKLTGDAEHGFTITGVNKYNVDEICHKLMDYWK